MYLKHDSCITLVTYCPV